MRQQPEVGDYTLEREIGQGSFGSVRLARHKVIGSSVAIKIIDKEKFVDDDDLLVRFKREVSILQELVHPYVSEYFDLLEDEKMYYLVMEYVENGNLLEFVNKRGKLNENLAQIYLCQLISVLEVLHEKLNIVHRDLKAENILLDRKLNIRVIDFGLSNTFTSDSPLLRTACGSPAYAPPEMVKGQLYSKASDIWSTGILLYAMCTGELPFEDENMQRLLQKIAFTDPIIPPYISNDLQDLLTKMLTKDPNRRITISQIKEHPWFNMNEYSRLIPYRSDEGINQEIVEQIRKFNIDCSSLEHELCKKTSSNLAALYRMLKKYKITSQMDNHINNLDSIRPIILRQNDFNGNNTPSSPIITGPRRTSFGGMGEAIPTPHLSPKPQRDRNSYDIISPTPVQRMQKRLMSMGTIKSPSPRNVIPVPQGANSPINRFRARSSSVREGSRGDVIQPII